MAIKYTTKTSTIKATSADIRNLSVASAGIQAFTAEDATLKSLHSTSVEVTDTANISNLNANSASVELLNSPNASIANLQGKTITLSGTDAKITAPSAELTRLASTNASLTNVTSTSITASGKITSPSAELTNVTSSKVATDELAANTVTVNGSDLSELIEAAAVDVGDKVQDDRYPNVGNIVFKGSYVNVVKDPNSSKITLWINKSTAFPGLADSPLSGAPSSTGSAKLYSDTTDNFILPVNSGAVYSKITQIVEDGTNFSNLTMSLRNEDGNLTFNSDKTNSFWARIVYNGIEGSWLEIPFYLNAGEFDINKIYESPESTSPFSGTKLSKTDNAGLTVKYFVRPFDDNDAEFGRVPGQAEVEIEIELAMNTILSKDGGIVRFDYAISNTRPSEVTHFSSVDMFFTEYKKPSLTFTSAEYSTKNYSSAVSGLKYNTNGSIARISISNLVNSQWKASNTSDVRIAFNSAGTTSTINIGETGLTVTGENSAAVYAYSGSVTLGTSGTGTATITATPKGYQDGTAASKTLSQYWGSIPTSTALVENFGDESTYRMLTPSSTAGSYPSSEDVTTHKITGINNTNIEHCSAVCQYGSLYHPANTTADATGKQYSTTESRPAVFIRTFTGTANNKFKLVANNLIQKDKVQVWWKDGNNWYDLSTHVKGNVEHSGTNTITKFILPEAGETKRGDMTIAIVMNKGANPIGQITASFSA